MGALEIGSERRTRPRNLSQHAELIGFAPAGISGLRVSGAQKRAGIDLAKLDAEGDKFVWGFTWGGSKKLVDWAEGWQKKEAVEHNNIFAQTEAPPGTAATPAGVWKAGKK
ncbi:hypothetical protein RAS1_33160 [Phycisphaerae bacterium RAS1]|nr:hypothetical protein RAS1_33160 [Phycisphaerae bacterium RAS1]